jgi:uncharacterized protein YmfQ (DUF2313 family)
LVPFGLLPTTPLFWAISQQAQTGTLEDKRHVLSCLGSSLVLSGKQLQIQIDKNLALFQEIAPEAKSLHNRLEPAQVVGPLTDWEALYAQNKKWGP